MLTGLYRSFYQVILQFQDEGLVMRVTNKDLFDKTSDLKISKKDIIGDFDFIPEPSESPGSYCQESHR